MSVHAVTARQGGGASAPRRIPRAGRAFPPAARAASAASRRAIATIARSLVGKTSPIPVAVIIGAWVYYNGKAYPPAFPGWDNIAPDYTVEHQHPQIISPGDYAPNGFSHGSYVETTRDGLLDLDDGDAITGFRYWGHFHSGLAPPHQIIPLPKGDDWPFIPVYVPPRNPGYPINPVRPRPMYPAGYTQLPNIATLNDLILADVLPDSIVVTIPLTEPGAISQARVTGAPFGIGTNAPRKRTRRELKLRARNALMFHILKRLVNIPFEAKEWIDILAEAGDFWEWLRREREGFKRPGPRPPPWMMDGRHTNLLKAWYLFQLGGINNLDYELLIELIVENEIEDFSFGIAGRASKFAARRMGSPLGPQFGPLM